MDVTLSKSTVTVGTSKKTLVAITPVETDKVEQKQFHHIHVLDRSGSMTWEIDTLIDNVQATIKEVDDNDLISIIWFSSPGEYRTLVKGTKKSDNLLKLLDSLRHTLGTTCFSDPIKEINLIVTELYDLCPNISVTFFTDGQPVVPWSLAEEERKIFDCLDQLKEKIVAVNTVGYGCGYNQNLLQRMASVTEYGVFVHSTAVDNYKDIFVKNYEVLSGTVAEPINVKAQGEIVYLTTGFTKLAENELALTRMGKTASTIFVLGKDDFDVDVDGVKTNTKNITDAIPDLTKETFLYAYAYNMFYLGKRQKCLDVVAKNIRDKALADTQMSVFTFDEAANYINQLEQALHDTTTRYADGKCPANYLPKHNAHCVMDVILALAEDNAYYLPMHKEAEKYQRTRRKVEDAENAFSYKKDLVMASFEDFIFSEDRMNVSIRFKAYGTVKLNHKAAQRVGLAESFDSFVYRAHTVIKDGTLNIKKMVVAMSDAAFKSLKKAGTTMTSLKADKATLASLKKAGMSNPVVAIIELDKLPIINRTYLSKGADMSKVFSLCNDMIVDQAVQKWIGHYVKAVDAAFPELKEEAGVFKSYTPEQIQVLEDHGVDKTGVYKGINNTMTSAANSDSYETRSLSFIFKGVSSLPSVKDVEARIASGKTPTISQQIMIDAKAILADKVAKAGQDLNNLTRELKPVLETELKEVRARLRQNRYWLGGVKIAKMLTGDWFEELTEADDKGNYVYTQADKTLLVKAKTVTEYL